MPDKPIGFYAKVFTELLKRRDDIEASAYMADFTEQHLRAGGYDFGRVEGLREVATPQFFGLPVTIDDTLPEDTIQFRAADGRVLGTIVNLGKGQPDG